MNYATPMKLYRDLPLGMKSLVGYCSRIVPRSRLLGPGFRRRFAMLREMEFWPRAQLEDYQNRRVEVLMRHAYRSVPFYRRLMVSRGLGPRDFRRVEDLQKLPVITKDEIRGDPDAFQAADLADFRAGVGFTAGSTGVPLRFLLDQTTREMYYAAWWRQLFSGGVKNLNARKASLRGDFAHHLDRASRMWFMNAIGQELALNSYRIDGTSVRRLVGKLRKFRPEVLSAFPHSAYVFARTMQNEDLRFDAAIKVIQTSSEQLFPGMRSTIETQFGAPILDWYGQSESVVSFYECTEGSMHLFMEAGVAHVRKDRRGRSRLIGTSLTNLSMPFINYEVGDSVSLDMNSKCGCGRQSPTARIEGRISEFLVGANGNPISGTAFEHFWKHEVTRHLTKPPEYVHFVQDSLSVIELRYFRAEEFGAGELELIEGKLRILLGENSDLHVVKLDRMPVEGKWRIIESKMASYD